MTSVTSEYQGDLADARPVTGLFPGRNSHSGEEYSPAVRAAACPPPGRSGLLAAHVGPGGGRDAGILRCPHTALHPDGTRVGAAIGRSGGERGDHRRCLRTGRHWQHRNRRAQPAARARDHLAQRRDGGLPPSGARSLEHGNRRQTRGAAGDGGPAGGASVCTGSGRDRRAHRPPRRHHLRQRQVLRDLEVFAR